MLLGLALISGVAWAIGGSSVCQQSTSRASRPHSVGITEFGAVGDGVTLNTKAFQNAIFYLHSFADKGGAQLFVPAGRWLTGSFTLISHLTLFLDKGAVILGSKVCLQCPFFLCCNIARQLSYLGNFFLHGLSDLHVSIIAAFPLKMGHL